MEGRSIRVTPDGPRGVLLSRRQFLSAAAGIGAFALLPGCRGDGGPGASDTPSEAAPGLFEGDPDGVVTFANWPLYIDEFRGKIPSLKAFTDETEIEVTYEAVINDYPSFFAKMLPSLESGQLVGYDVIVLGGRELFLMYELGYTTPLESAPRPNFDRFAADWVHGRAIDPDSTFAMPWQGGFTGIAVNRDEVAGPITRLGDLADPTKVGTASVGMITMEMGDFVMAQLGIDVASSGPAEWQEAADWLLMQRESGTVRKYYGADYLDDLMARNLAATMAWSGDIVYRSIWEDRSELEFSLPEGRGLVWSDDVLIPVGAEHPIDAIRLMDYYYQPEIANLVTQWVLYLSPVEGVQGLLLRDAGAAEEEGARAYANKLRATANDPFSFPEATLVESLDRQRVLRSDEELEQWNSIFLPISQ